MSKATRYVKGLWNQFLGEVKDGMHLNQTNKADDEEWQPDIVCSTEPPAPIEDWILDMSDAHIYGTWSPPKSNNNDLDNSKSGEAYLIKQVELIELLQESIELNEKKEHQSQWLQQENERHRYDLACRRIEMEEEVRKFELELKYKSLSDGQQIEIERLKLEVDRLKMLLLQKT